MPNVGVHSFMRTLASLSYGYVKIIFFHMQRCYRWRFLPVQSDTRQSLGSESISR